MFLAVPLIDSEDAVNMTITVTNPAGTTSTLGPFTTDTTGGTFTTFTPTATGNYTFQLHYGGQTLTGSGYVGTVEQSSSSPVETLSVTSTQASYLPLTPLPTQYWQTPVNAENVQNWASLTGPWLGTAVSTFASTGEYNASGDYNPYTSAPTTSHIIWTKVWMAGGVAGGELGNSEAGSDYWTTCQYTPRYAPVIINGIEYATWYTTTTSSSNGVIAINLYTGQTEWVINTQDPLVFGMQVNWENPNQYGVCGPYIFTSGAYPGVVNVGTEYNMYDATTGNYLCSIVNGTAASYYAEDNQGDIVGYLINNTVGTQMVHPEPGVNVPVTNNGSSLEMWNLTNALGQSGSALRDWGISVGQVFPWSNGLEYEVQSVPTTFNGASLVTMGLFGPAGLGQGLLEPYEISGNTLVFDRRNHFCRRSTRLAS